MIFDEEVCHLLDELGLGTYTPTAVGGDVFLGDLPDSPDSAIAVRGYTGSGSGNAKFGWDQPAFQVIVRGAQADTSAAGDRAQGIYDALQGVSKRDLAGGTHLLTCVGLQSSPVWLRRDANSRPQYVINFRADTERDTPNRQ